MRDMNIRIRILGLLLVATLLLCVTNVTAASTSTPTTVTHNGYAPVAKSQDKTTLQIMFIDNDGNEVTKTPVNQPVALIGRLFSGDPDSPNMIGGAKINIQLQQSGKWSTVFTTTTLTSNNDTGYFYVQWTPDKTGQYSYRATFPGNSQYASAVSNVVKITVTSA